MPLIEINTSAQIEVTDDKLSKLAEKAGEVLSKPASKVLVSINVQKPGSIFFQGNSEPAASITFKSVGNFSALKNDQIYTQMEPVFAEVLGIKPNRFYCHMVLMAPEDVGFNGMTVLERRRKAQNN